VHNSSELIISIRLPDASHQAHRAVLSKLRISTESSVLSPLASSIRKCGMILGCYISIQWRSNSDSGYSLRTPFHLHRHGT